MTDKAKLKPLFLSFLAWLFEDEAYAYVRSGKPFNRRRIFHDPTVIRLFCWAVFVLPFILAALVFWAMANIPYFVITILVFWACLTVSWAAWKVEAHEGLRFERTDAGRW